MNPEEFSPKTLNEFHQCLHCWDPETVNKFAFGYRKLFGSIAATFGFRQDERNDFVQHCFSKVVEKQAEYKKHLELWPWIATIGWREGHNNWRRLQSRSKREAAMEVEPSGRQDASVFQHLADRESFDDILRVIQILRMAARDANGNRGVMQELTIDIALYKMQSGKRSVEVAKDFDCSQSYVDVAVHRVRTEIRRRFGFDDT